MSYKELVPILDREFSRYVRMYDANEFGIVTCATCGSIHHWKDITLGHYISRWHHSVRWDNRNVAPQCIYCNSFKGGEQHKMRAYLVSLFGEEEIQKMERYAEETKTETAETLREKIKRFRESNKNMEGRFASN